MKMLTAQAPKREPKEPEPFIDTVVAVGPKRKVPIALTIEHDSLHRITGLDYKVGKVSKKVVVKNDLLFAWAEFEQTVEGAIHDMQTLPKGAKRISAKKAK